MPHIILRLPYYVACFMRNPSPDISLKATEAYKFSQYSDEYCLMAHALVMQNCAEHISSPCFSEQAWQRMRNGYGIGRNFSSSPLSEPVADSDTLSDSDVMALAGVSFGCREGFGDYLRIAIPKEIVADGRIVRTNKTFFLPRSAASQMSSMLKRRFRRGMMEYMRGDGRYCELHRVRRSVMERLSRFMTKYDIPYSPDRNEVVLLKRLYYRWREREDFTAEEEMEFGYGFTPPLLK